MSAGAMRTSGDHPRGIRSAGIRLLGAAWPALVVLVVFILTLAPSVTGEDSGELITAAHFFGVPHPPGYPLWTILCGICTHVVPLGTIAWRANLFSAVCTAGGVAFLAGTLRRMGFNRIIAGSAAAACGLTTAVWSQSVIAEVYALSLLLTAALMWLFVRWHADGRCHWLIWASWVFGLGMANHHILGFTALGLGVWALIRSPGLLRNARLLLTCIAVFFIGLLPYVYLLWAGQRDVPVRWGETDSLAAVWEHASRGQYKSDKPEAVPTPRAGQSPRAAGILAGRFYYGIRWQVRQFTPILTPILVAGMVWLWRRRSRRPFFWLVVIVGFCCGPLYLYVGGPRLGRQDEFIQKVFLTPLAFVSAIPLAAGLHWLVQSLRSICRRIGNASFRCATVAVPILVVATPLVAHWQDNNMRRYWYAHDHAQNMLAGMLPNAIIFPSGDHNTFPLIYLIHVEGRRPDVTIADKYGYIDLDLYENMPDNPGKPRTKDEREAIEEWIIRNAKRPVYFTVKKTSPVQSAKTVPVGLLYHLLPNGFECDTETCWDRIRYRNLEGAYAPEDYAAANILADYYYALAARELVRGNDDEARERFDECLTHAWGIKEIYNNVGSALAEAGMVGEAVGYYEQAARSDWRYGPARWNLAKIFRSLGQYAWSAKVFEDLTRATPDDFRPYGELGFLYRNHLDDLERARFWWYESLRRNPRQPQVIAALAEGQVAKVDPAEATTSQTTTATSRPATSQPTTTAPGTRESGRLWLSETDIDLGRVVEGLDSTVQLLFQNTGDGALTILGVEASCSCVIGDVSERSYAPGESGELTVGLKTAGTDGWVSETLTIKSDDPDAPARQVVLRATVVPEVSAEPSSVHLTSLPNKRPAPFQVVVTNNLGQAFEIEQVKCSAPWLRADWPPKARAASHVLHIECTRPVSESTDEWIEIHTTLPDHKVIRVTVAYQTTMPARATPSLIYLGRIVRGRRAGRTIEINAVRPDLPLELALVRESLVPGVEAELRKVADNGSAWRLSVTVDGSVAPAGAFQHTIQIGIAGCDLLIEVPVHGYVAE